MNNEILTDCSSRPNCVFSEAEDAGHLVAPFRLKTDIVAGWDEIRRVVDSLPCTTVIQATDYYLRVECRSRVFRFIDDLELQLDPATSIIKVRSASRVGYWDLGVNRRRVEILRRKLKENDLIQ